MLSDIISFENSDVKIKIIIFPSIKENKILSYKEKCHGCKLYIYASLKGDCGFIEITEIKTDCSYNVGDNLFEENSFYILERINKRKLNNVYNLIIPLKI